MSERCHWPGCRDVHACVYLGIVLCDKHGDLVQSESANVAARSRKKLGLSPITMFVAKEVPEPVRVKPEREQPEGEEFSLDEFRSRLEGGAYDWDGEE